MSHKQEIDNCQKKKVPTIKPPRAGQKMKPKAIRVTCLVCYDREGDPPEEVRSFLSLIN